MPPRAGLAGTDRRPPLAAEPGREAAPLATEDSGVMWPESLSPAGSWCCCAGVAGVPPPPPRGSAAAGCTDAGCCAGGGADEAAAEAQLEAAAAPCCAAGAASGGGGRGCRLAGTGDVAARSSDDFGAASEGSKGQASGTCSTRLHAQRVSMTRPATGTGLQAGA